MISNLLTAKFSFLMCLTIWLYVTGCSSSDNDPGWRVIGQNFTRTGISTDEPALTRAANGYIYLSGVRNNGSKGIQGVYPDMVVR